MLANIKPWIKNLMCFLGVIGVAYLDFLTSVDISFVFVYFIVIVISTYLAGDFAYFLAIVASFAKALIFNYSHVKETDTGYLIWQLMNVSCLYIATVYLIKTNEKSLKVLKEISLTDPLTKLPNRRSFEGELNRLVGYSQRNHITLLVAYIDLDKFKEVNDQYGHSVGDEVLVTIGNIITKSLRQESFVARLGGDEFSIVCLMSHAENVPLYMTRIKASLDEEMLLKKWPITFSIGVTLYDGSFVCTGEQVLDYADKVMYAVKHSSRNAIKYETMKL